MANNTRASTPRPVRSLHCASGARLPRQPSDRPHVRLSRHQTDLGNRRLRDWQRGVRRTVAMLVLAVAVCALGLAYSTSGTRRSETRPLPRGGTR